MIEKIIKEISELKDGYCLWVGAGIDIYLSSISDLKLPTWEKLISNLEAMVEKETGKDYSVNKSYKYFERFQIIQNRLSIDTYQSYIYNEIFLKLSASIIKAEEELNKTGELFPKIINNIAKLSHLANPIVNFNIEYLSSIALALPGGEYAIKVFGVPTPDSLYPFSFIANYTRDNRTFKRQIFHPHGTIESSGKCVLSKSEYEALNGTLALTLATHSAFASDLVIVGMSLEDDYLKEQISKFRNQIRNIYWFTDIDISSDPDLEKWINMNGVILINIPNKNWNLFWDLIDKHFNGPDTKSIIVTWANLVLQSLQCFENWEEILKKYNYDDTKIVKSIKEAKPNNELIELYRESQIRGILSASNRKINFDKNRLSDILKNMKKRLEPNLI
ncbi:MAG: hypothetical protein A2X61_12695 [Ignavibacteria bacterium GWB2_35_12]|nr:MAG: hypothetical protein A2X61_12695 [Ignavibacteria bacterium GWB2_35_12]OGU91380.1 MAG: hypothetical protein A2220_08510 [Ignavibacteria bacterium RIFOXYA2_FULL_35_10]OGV24973.1 MAG: hypothetical protein A2475_16535 [Ignavibacteria bacterium RIFOXYC2_FULL_35_21]